MRLDRAVGLLCAAAAVSAGCGDNRGDARPGNVATVPASAPVSPPAGMVPPALDFVATTVGGQEFSAATLARRPVVLWFWTPWCPTCRAEAPEVAKVARDNPDVAFVGVSAQAEPPAMQEFIDTYGTGVFTNLADLDGAVWRRFGVTGQPSFALIRRDGSMELIRGPLSKFDLVVQVANLKH